ncbi:hypothetical protein RCL1_008631 [Eukaryota sp. TZLM3-RCL]
MPSVKAAAVATTSNTPFLGRMSTNVAMALVGLPNVGKSTLFNILTKSQVKAENFAFCTIDPNLAQCLVPDTRFDHLVETFKPASAVPAHLNIYDIAGLVRGASDGLGLGNAFLSHIRAVDGIYHLVRTFEDVEVMHTDGEVNPVNDLETITEELIKKDLEMVKKHVDKLSRLVRSSRDYREEHEFFTKIQELLQEGGQVRFGNYDAKEVDWLNEFQLLTAKPVIYLVNLSESDYCRRKNKFLPAIAKWVQEHGNEPVIPFSAVYERTLAALDGEQREAYIKENKAPSALEKIIHMGYKTLQLQHFFTAGTDEVKCWTVRKGYSYPKGAGVIHSDMENGFIMAEVMKFDDFKEHGSTEVGVRAAGKLQQQGKTGVISDGDICFFKFGRPSSKKK